MGCCNSRKANKLTIEIDSKLLAASALDKTERKILLIGPEFAGKSLISKQIDCIYNYNGNLDIKKHSSLINNIRTECIRFTLNICTIINDKQSFEYLQQLQHQHLWAEIGEYMQKIWKLNNTKLISTHDYDIEYISYYMDKIIDIMDNHYTLTQQDILYYHQKSKFMEITWNRWRLIINNKRWHNNKKIYLFQHVRCVIFVAALTDYCRISKLNGINAMKDSLDYFQEILHSQWMKETRKIVLLTKDDLFRMTLKRGVSLSLCFGDEWNGPEFPNYKIDLIISYMVRSIEILLDRYDYYVPVEIINLIMLYSKLEYIIDDNKVEEKEYFEHCYKKSVEFIGAKFGNCQCDGGVDTMSRKVHVLVANAMDRNNVKFIWKCIERIVVIRNISHQGFV